MTGIFAFQLDVKNTVKKEKFDCSLSITYFKILICCLDSLSSFRIQSQIKKIENEKTHFASSNILDSMNAFELYVEDEKELEGLSQSSLNQAAESAEKKGKK